jgi:hypothetical protein
LVTFILKISRRIMNIETVAASKRAELFGMLDRHAVGMCDGRGLVIADSTLEDTGVLLDNLEPGTDFLFVDSGLDFEVTLQCALSGGYSALHFLGHGHEGAITLGGRAIEVDDFTALSSGEHADSPSFHFWSCSTGSGVKGRAFVDGIAQAFGSTVTAFSGLVGSGERGGSWVPDVLSSEDGNTVVPFVQALAYQHTLVPPVPAAFQLTSAVTATGIDVQVWLKAGYSFDTFTLVMNYGTANATYTGAVTSSALTGWIVQPSLVSPGNLEIAGMNLTKFTSTSDVLLETISFTIPPGANGFTTSLVTGTGLEDSMLPVPSLPLGTLPVINYGVTVDNAIVDFAENHTATDIVGADADALDADGGPVTFSLLSVPTNGGGTALFSINASTGQISLTPAGALAIDYESATKSYALTVQATDSVAWVDQRSITLNVSNVNDNAPVFTSSGIGSVDENKATTTVIYTATTTDADNLLACTYSLDGTDAELLNITSDGVVTLKASADYETKTSYSFNVLANDGANITSSVVDVTVNNLNDNAPVFTSGGTGSVNENAATTTIIYNAATTDADNLLARTYSLSGTDMALLNITSAGVVTLKASADYEAQTSYSFNVIANDGANNTTQAVVVSVNNLNDNVPVLTVDNSSVNLAENAVAGLIGGAHAHASDADGAPVLTLDSPLNGASQPLFSINGTTGEISLTTAGAAAIDYESSVKSYTLTVKASDGLAAHDQSQTITLNLTNVNDNAPVFTSGITGAVDDKAAASTVIYTATTTDADNLLARTYSLGGTDMALLNITTDGVVTLKAPASYSTHSSYSFDVVADDGANHTTQAVVVSVLNGHDLIGDVLFWKGGAALAGVTSTLDSAPAATGSQLVEFRNIQVAADGTRTVEVWETSAKTDIGSVQLELTLPDGSVASWVDAAGLPSGWSTIANTSIPGQFLLGGFGMTALSAGPLQLGTLTLTAPTNPQHFDLSLTAGDLGSDSVPAFGIVSDTMTTGIDGLYQHLEMVAGDYALTSTKVSGTAESTAIKANDALAALKMAVGMNPNADGSVVSSYQYLAADVNKDGFVKAADALNILKMAVKLDTAPAKEWLFVPDSAGSESMTRNHVVWPDNPVSVTLDIDQELHLIGIVKGDVNGSWIAPVMPV